ncbi:DNA methyltransferase [Albibacterium indicum]|uniref:DNA methyltransferase n=1 Tax=Albibacterium indicum TaxID=2292082 RepID=UPI000E4CB2BC|nr:DNA methyltransferase [Pedobacter indicus]
MTQELFSNEEQHTNGPVTVLGKTFANDEERRSYFREELRKKLPELKEIDGFPIGEEEDIINLSDPPFYTACPNPWINDFIAEWEEEKKQLEKEGKRVPNFEVTEPYAADVSEGKNNPIYTAHTYHTKVPHPAIMRYIMHYTQPGDIIYDGFAGTGMTGVAAAMCENPESDIKAKIEKDNNNVIWGQRKAICSDLSPYASMISYNYNSPLDLIEANHFLDKLESDMITSCQWLYKTKHINNDLGTINYIVWSDVFLCVDCNKELVFWNEALSFEEKKVIDNFNCPHCNAVNNQKKSEKVWETKFDSIVNDTIKIAKNVPVYIVYSYNNKRFTKSPDDYDLELINQIENYKLKTWAPTYKIPKGYNTDQPIRSHGISFVHLFYTKRNLIALSILNDYINRSKYSSKFKFILTGMINRSTKMNRIHVKNFFFGGGGWNAGHLKGTLYIPALPIETSILEQISDKIKSYKTVLQKLSNRYNNLVSVASATKSTIKNNSIDYIFTDPPFGANIMYSELNILPESWLKVLTSNEKEAIENKIQGKNTFDYQRLMTESFNEYYRVLKPGKWMTVEFSNTSAAVWNSIQNALLTAGFVISNVAGIDKKQGGIRSITTATAVRQDLAITCYKPSSEFDTKFQESQHSPMGVWDFVEEHLSHLPIHLVKENATTAVVERSAKILLDRLIAFYVQRSLPVPIDAGKFQEGLKERFVERDGMYFTQEQVEEYERKKAEVPEFIQMSLFVGSEQDAVYWLRQLLEKEHRTEQDLHPLWMREVAGNMRKGDTLPEMRQILEENFLKDESGKWYVPDAENEADLEKLRNKRLLKIFEDYKAEAAKPKGKLKEVRVEALRVGFKQCYQDKDFKTIVNVGDRIPNNLLMEDEVLLQFYDIASAKI